MKINLFTLDNFSLDNLSIFFISIKKIKFVFKDILLLESLKNENNLILAPPKIKKNYLKKSLKKLEFFKLSNSCFLIPSIIKKEIKYSNLLLIDFPIKIDILEHQLINFFSRKKYSYKNCSLINNNFLMNNLNNKQVYLTEIESKIIKLLFTCDYVLKQTINSDVLNQQSGVESKSLESHLYRLRKKILNLGAGQIIADGEKSIKIK